MRPLILCVDDEKNVLKSLERVLKAHFRVITAENTDEAFVKFRESSEEVSAVVTDINMPGKSGMDLLEDGRGIDPEISCIILSGQDDIDHTIRAINNDLVFQYIKKPWKNDELLRAVTDAVSRTDQSRVSSIARKILETTSGELERFYDEISSEIGISDEAGISSSLKDKLEKFRKLTEVGNFSSKIIHDIKNKVAILGAGFDIVIKNAHIPEKVSSIVASVKNSIADIDHMTDDLQMYVSDKQVDLDLEKVDAYELFRDYEEDLKLLVGKRQIAIKIDIVSGLFLNVDRKRFKRVIINLAKNAFEAMKDGELSISAQKKNGEAVIKLSDTGSGMPEEIKTSLFKPYTSFKSGGVGLGLINVKEIVEKHGGTISVESEIGKGSVFIMHIPLEK